jgi:hypothetical protein
MDKEIRELLERLKISTAERHASELRFEAKVKELETILEITADDKRKANTK